MARAMFDLGDGIRVTRDQILSVMRVMTLFQDRAENSEGSHYLAMSAAMHVLDIQLSGGECEIIESSRKEGIALLQSYGILGADGMLDDVTKAILRNVSFDSCMRSMARESMEGRGQTNDPAPA